MKFRIVLVQTLLLSCIYNSAFAQKTLGDDHFHKGDTFLLFNNHDSSIYNFEKAREIYVKIGYWRGIIAADNKIAENLCGTYDLEKAMKLAKEAYKMSGEHLGEWDIEKANALINMGNIHFLSGQHDQALAEYENAWDIANHEFHEDVLFSAPTSLGIGNVYFGKNQYANAFKHFQNALENNINILGEEHPYVANSYLALGNLYRNKGSYNLATEYYEHALRINKKVFGENHPDVATTYVGMAEVFKNSGEYDMAMQYYRQAQNVYQNFLHEKNPKYGAIYLGIADVSKNTGDFQNAEKYYQQAFDLYELTIGLEHQSTVRSVLGLGNTFMMQERFPEALQYYNQVLDINFNLVGEHHVNSSAANNNLGSIYYFFGEFELALRYFKKALEIDIAIHGHDHPDVANAYHNIARVYGEQGDIQSALDYIQNAISSSIIDFEDENVYVNPVLVNFFDNKDLLFYLGYKGELLEAGFRNGENIKGLDVALQNFILSDELIDKIRQSYTQRRDKEEMGELVSSIYESSVSAAFTLTELLSESNVQQVGDGKSYAEKKKEYENRFFFFTEKHKGAVLYSSVAQTNPKKYGDIPETVLYQENELKELISIYTQELAAYPEGSMLDFYQRELETANQEYEDLIYQFEYDYPDYYELKYSNQVPSLEEVQGFLNDTTMILSYYSGSSSLYTAQISKTDFKISKTRKKNDFERSIASLRQAIVSKNDGDYLRHAATLYKQLFPFEIPDQIKSLIIVQDGNMLTIPFEALLTKEVNPGAMDFATLPYLLREYNISYSPSVNLLIKTFSDQNTNQSGGNKNGLVLAPLTFENSIDALQAAKEKSYDEAEVAMSLRTSLSISENQIGAMPDSKTEAEAIANMFRQNGGQADSYIGGDATEEWAKSGTIGNYSYIHFATHVIVDQSEPEFSGVLLKESGSDDGILFSGEWYDLDLNADMVTISASETGIGNQLSGQGTLGFTRAMIYAGAKNLTYSLWTVPTTSSTQLMTSYYQGFLRGRETPQAYASALKAAKMKQIEAGGEMAHPFYWSTFILIGR
ncbi:CHAT domain-containing protein [Reichenbachiella ulvae]|uniref:CHAT domain-containing protein n=1 Tax=Reichenbachiella ulvae TaxID=2980104 RepID=A0ABT3CYC2_9BACT|nr:CHAT domain-containing tetratricopeptide repeat protein [Reichenbachiella ulvae]MCV9388554.1 CHAT domain-containing protein [Reichenbachiella ulvae]